MKMIILYLSADVMIAFSSLFVKTNKFNFGLTDQKRDISEVKDESRMCMKR